MPVTVQELAPEIKELRPPAVPHRRGVCVRSASWRVKHIGWSQVRRGEAAAELLPRLCVTCCLLFRAGMGVLCSFMGAIPLSLHGERRREQPSTLFFCISRGKLAAPADEATSVGRGNSAVKLKYYSYVVEWGLDQFASSSEHLLLSCN